MSDSTTQPAQTATAYLKITQWGVELPLSSSISEAYYVVPDGMAPDSDGVPSGIFVGVHSLDSACGATTATAAGASNRLGEIIRANPTGTDPVTREAYKQKYPGGTTINGWYYGFLGVPTTSACTGASSTSSVLAAFKTAAGGMIATSSSTTTNPSSSN